MPSTKIKLNVFLQEEALKIPVLLAYLEEDVLNSNNIIVSSWNKALAFCDFSFSINKSDIDSVEKTADVVYILGKSYTLVNVNFKRNASISFEDLFRQIRSGSLRVMQDWRKDPFSRYPYGYGIA